MVTMLHIFVSHVWCSDVQFSEHQILIQFFKNVFTLLFTFQTTWELFVKNLIEHFFFPDSHSVQLLVHTLQFWHETPCSNYAVHLEGR